MSPKKDNEDRERPSWREIDRRRETPGEKPPAKERLPKKRAEWVRKMALRQAEALFKGKKGRPEYQKALKELEAAQGAKKFPVVARKFLEEYGLPEEWGILTLLLDFPDPAVVLEVLNVMAGMAALRSRVEQQGFRGKLKIWALTSPDQELRRRAEEILDNL
jgi:hypothetical protein